MFNNRTTGGDNTVEVDGENWNYYCNLFPPPSPVPNSQPAKTLIK